MVVGGRWSVVGEIDLTWDRFLELFERMAGQIRDEIHGATLSASGSTESPASSTANEAALSFRVGVSVIRVTV